jgi:L-fuconolactonase
MAMQVIDIHPHVISTDEKRYPRDPLDGHQSVWSKERPVSTEQMIAAMDQAGVAKSALVHSSTCYGYDNSYVADAVAAHPDRFTGVCSVDMLAPDAPEKIRYWAGRGMSGLRIFTAGSTMEGQGDWLADPRSFPAWECAGELRMTVCVQMRLAGLPMLKVLLDRFSHVTMIIDHLLRVPLEEGPPYAGAQGLFELARHKNIFMKLTINNVRDAKKGKASAQTFFKRVVDEFGASRIAWGSNFPASTGSLKEILAESREALSFLTQKDQDQIFGGTALALYPVLAAN